MDIENGERARHFSEFYSLSLNRSSNACGFVAALQLTATEQQRLAAVSVVRCTLHIPDAFIIQINIYVGIDKQLRFRHIQFHRLKWKSDYKTQKNEKKKIETKN